MAICSHLAVVSYVGLAVTTFVIIMDTNITGNSKLYKLAALGQLAFKHTKFQGFHTFVTQS